MVLSFDCDTPIGKKEITWEIRLWRPATTLLSTASLNVTQMLKLFISMYCERKTRSRRHTMKNYDRVRSNGGHLYILRLNFDFNDHKEFVGSWICTTKETVFQISSVKTSSCLMELVSPNLRFITKVSTAWTAHAFDLVLRMALYLRHFMLWCPVTARSSTKHATATGLGTGIIHESRSLNNLTSKCIVTQYVGLTILFLCLHRLPRKDPPKAIRPLQYMSPTLRAH